MTAAINPDTHFIAPDADGDLNLWHGTREDPAPVAVLRECDTDPAVWAVVVAAVSTPDRLTDEEREALAALIRREVGWPDRQSRELADTILAARLAAHPPATDRDAVLRALVSDWQANSASRSLGDPTAATWHQAARQLLDALAARPAPDTLADRVQALAEEWERSYAAMLIGGFSGCSIGADTAAKRLRALLAGRSDASPEGGA